MERISLDENLHAYQCPESEGIFLPVESYFRWLGRQPERLPHLPVSDKDPEEAVEDSSSVKICPETGQIMHRFKVGHGFPFHLDRSPSGSIWLDKGEWEALKKRQYHDELHLIFTAPWQSKVRADQKCDVEHQILNERLGPALLAKLDDIKSDLAEHEHRQIALAYLQR